MIRDVNGVRQALQRAGALGRRGDNQMAHVGTGEVMIPPQVVDKNPQILGPLVKAFQKSGMDWRRYLVGAPQNSRNPNTGAKEFSYGSDTPGGSVEGIGGDESGIGGGSGGDDKNSPTGLIGNVGFMTDPMPDTLGFNPIGGKTAYEGAPPPNYDFSRIGKAAGGLLGLFTGGPVGAITGAVSGGKIGATLSDYANTPAPPGGFAGGPPSPSEGSDLSGGLPSIGSGTSEPYVPPQPIEAPSYLEFNPEMTALQQRAQIATFGLNADDSRYTSEETVDYYKNLLQNSLSEGGTLLPIEKQFLEQVLGIAVPDDMNELLKLLGGQTTGGRQSAFAGSGDPFRTDGRGSVRGL